MNATGKAARKRYGNRYDAKRAKPRKKRRKEFGKLPVSFARGNAEQFVRTSGVDLP